MVGTDWGGGAGCCDHAGAVGAFDVREMLFPVILLLICKCQAAHLFFMCIFCTLCVFHNKTFFFK